MTIKNPIKIFLLGFPRNGTSSFAKLFHEATFKTTHESKSSLSFCEFDLNPENYTYYTKHHPSVHSSELSKQLIEKLNQVKLKEFIDQHDVFTDFPWPLLYPYLAENYPEAYFILSERDVSKWFQSMVLYFKNTLVESFNTLYLITFLSGLPSQTKGKYTSTYLKWNQEIKDFFLKRPHLKFMSYNLAEDNTKIKNRIENLIGTELELELELKGIKLGNFPSQNSNQMKIKKFKKFTKLNFRLFDLRGYSFFHCLLTGIDFTEANLEGANFQGVSFKDCRFNQTLVKGANFTNAIFKGCEFFNTRMNEAILDNITIKKRCGRFKV